MRRLLLSVVTIVLLSQASLTLAQSDPGRDAEARGLFEAGRAAFDQGRYPDALGYFDRAYQLSRRPQLLYNIGQVHDRLRHDDEALQAFQQYLKQVPSAANRSEVEHRIQALRQAMVGAIHFTIAPAGAQVWIDGEAKTLDASGRIELSTGSHEIVVRAEGYDELRQRMNVRGGDMIELPITLQASDGSSTQAPAITPATVITTPSQSPAVEPSNPSVIQPPATPGQAPAVTQAPDASASQSSITWRDNGGTSTATTLGWVSAIGSGAMLIGGLVFAGIGSSDFDALDKDCRSSCTREEITDKGSSIKTMQTLTNVGLIGGGVLAGLATILFVVGGSSGSEQAPQQPPALVVGPTSIMAQGSF